MPMIAIVATMMCAPIWATSETKNGIMNKTKDQKDQQQGDNRSSASACSESYFAIVIGRHPHNLPYFYLRPDDKGRMVPYLFESRTEAPEHAPSGSRVVRVDVTENISSSSDDTQPCWTCRVCGRTGFDKPTAHGCLNKPTDWKKSPKYD